jgi:hypothetical protein
VSCAFVVVTIPTALFKFEDLISSSEKLSHFSDIWFKNVSFGAKGRRGWQEQGPLLLLRLVSSSYFVPWH